MAGARLSGDSIAGHEIVPNTEGFVIEAWGQNPTSCFTEALSALVEEFAVIRDQPSTRLLPLSETKGVGEDALGQLLEEVVDALGVFDLVPIRFHLAETEDGGVAGDMEVVPGRDAEMAGPKPKAVSYHGVSVHVHRRGVAVTLPE